MYAYAIMEIIDDDFGGYFYCRELCAYLPHVNTPINLPSLWASPSIQNRRWIWQTGCTSCNEDMGNSGFGSSCEGSILGLHRIFLLKILKHQLCDRCSTRVPEKCVFMHRHCFYKRESCAQIVQRMVMFGRIDIHITNGATRFYC